jgi:hypothetical protein
VESPLPAGVATWLILPRRQRLPSTLLNVLSVSHRDRRATQGVTVLSKSVQLSKKRPRSMQLRTRMAQKLNRGLMNLSVFDQF